MPLQPRATSFNKVAEQYDKLRPGYPRSFIREIIREVGVPAGEIKAFEIGCGTGKATADFAKAIIAPHSRNSGLTKTLVPKRWYKVGYRLVQCNNWIQG